MRAWALAWPSVALLGLGSCGDDASAGPPRVEIGTGDVAFLPLVDGDDLFIVEGPQGGFHLVGSLRAWNLHPGNPDDLSSPGNPTMVFEAFVGDVQVDSGVSRYTQGLRAGEDDASEMVGRRIILDITDDAELDGAMLRVEVTATDKDGQIASDQRSVVGVPHPNNL